ncbi:ABC transporter ATP-binding protein [Candidatus Uhrbacteria bacterium]|nr:ABC transporter ATP-binding protein [Candidatus Uhrbacteria bacterium]
MGKANEQKIHARDVLSVFWSHIFRYKKRVFFMLFLIAFANAVDVLVPIFYKRFFDLLSGDLSAGTETVSHLLVATILIVAAIHGLEWVSWRTASLISTWFQPRLIADLEQTSLSYLHEHSYQFFSNNFAGSLVRKVHRLGRAFENFADQIEFAFTPLSVTLIGNLVVLFTRSHMLAGILFVWVILFLSLNLLYATWKLKYDFKSSDIDSQAGGVLADSITNAITVKTFTGRVFENGIFREVTERMRRAQMFTWRLGEYMDAFQSAFMFVIEFVIMYVAVQLWQKGILTIGDFALIQGLLLGIFFKIWDFGRSIRHLFTALAEADEMVQILRAPREIVDARHAKELQVQTGRIEFKNVTFSFNKTRRVLNKMNMVIKPKEKVALVGPSGAGKSTIIKLLFRFYDLEAGQIIIGNQDIARVTQESLRRNIALVPQEPILFHRSVMENIRYGRREATDEEVMEAARKAHAHEFIEELPQGYGTFVGERGVKLSGGERQRVAIARAILKNAPILVLDEATSSLDSESESLIQEALTELMRDKTTIVIAHRLSTIMKMDRIIVIQKGKVADSGTHEELLTKDEGIYKKLWEIQAGGFIQ